MDAGRTAATALIGWSRRRHRTDHTARGVGEPSIIPPSAIANASFNASGARITTPPFNPERVRPALN